MMLVASALGLGGILSATCFAADLTHRYSFALDASDFVGGANGVLEGNAAVVNGMLTLDGTNSSVQLPNNLFANYTSASFEIWYVDTPVNSTNADLFSFTGAGGKMYCTLGGQGIYSVGTTSKSVLLGLPAVGGTNHLVWTQDGISNIASLYVNGVLMAVTTNFNLTPTLVGATTNWLGGPGTNSHNYNFRGSMVEFRTYDDVLSVLDVAMTDALGPGQPLTDPGALQDLRLVLSSPTGPGAVFRAEVFADFASVTNVNISTQPDLVLASDTPSVISVGADQRLTTVALGSANVTAIWRNFSNSLPVTVAVPEGIALLHRYSFNEQVNDFIVHDSVGRANGRVFANMPTAAVYTGTNGLKMTGYPGYGQAYAALPGPLISGLSEVSIEAWVTWTPGNVPLGYGSGAWQRIFDFGNQTNMLYSGIVGQSYLFMTAATDPVDFNTNSVLHAAITTKGNLSEIPRLNWTNHLPTNVESFVTVTYSQPRGVAKLYLNGTLVDLEPAVIPLSGIIDTNCWLGRSLFAADPYFNGIFREFRIYSGLLADTDVAQDYIAGQAAIGEPWLGPQVSTFPASGVSATIATLSGTARPNGQDAMVYFQYGPTTSYGMTTAGMDIGNGSNVALYDAQLSGLAEQTLYHFRSFASNATAIVYGGDSSFTTSNDIVILPPIVIAPTSATLAGELVAGTLSNEVYFQYGLTTNYGGSTPVFSVVPGENSILVSASINNLTTNTQYFYRLVATNGNTARFSQSESFTTPATLIPITAFGLESGNQFYVNFNTPLIGTYQLQSSSDLVNWTTIGSFNAGPGGSAGVTDASPNTNNARFYRVTGP